MCLAQTPDLGVGQPSTTTIFTDSQSALAVARNPVFHARTKHIEVHYHYVRERLSVVGGRDQFGICANTG